MPNPAARCYNETFLRAGNIPKPCPVLGLRDPRAMGMDGAITNVKDESALAVSA